MWSITWVALALLAALVVLMVVIVGLQRAAEEAEDPVTPVSERSLPPGDFEALGSRLQLEAAMSRQPGA